jgi:hypothetical protein
MVAPWTDEPSLPSGCQGSHSNRPDYKPWLSRHVTLSIGSGLERLHKFDSRDAQKDVWTRGLTLSIADVLRLQSRC